MADPLFSHDKCACRLASLTVSLRTDTSSLHINVLRANEVLDDTPEASARLVALCDEI